MDNRCRVRAEWMVDTPEAAWRLAESLMDERGAKTASWVLPGDPFADETDGKAEAAIEHVRDLVRARISNGYELVHVDDLLDILHAHYGEED